jgi:hypothetical protein
MSPGPVQHVVQRPEGRYTVLRPPSSQRLLTTALFLGIGALSLLPDDSGERLPLVISVPLCAAMAVVAWAASRLRVELGPTVRIVNFWQTRVIPWNEVLEFGFADGDAWVVLANQRRQRTTAFSPGMRGLESIRRRSGEAVHQMENRRKRRLDHRRGRTEGRP